MELSNRHIATLLILLFLLLAVQVDAPLVHAESVIRIIGGGTSKATNNSGEQPLAEPSTSSGKESTTIRIISDKPTVSQMPSGDQSARPSPTQPSSPTKGIRVISNKAESVQEKAPEQAATAKRAAEVAEKALKIKAEEERISLESAVKRAQELADIKAEEDRKVAEKAELERLGKIKAEQERAADEAARQAAIIFEQKQLTARKAEELRRSTDKAGQERQNALKADEERLAAARKALVEKLRKEMEPPPQEPGAVGVSIDPSAAPVVRSVIPATGLENGTPPTPATIWDLYLSAKAIDPALGRTEARVTGSKADSDLLFSGLMPHLNSTAGIKQISQTLTNYAPTEAKNDFTALNYNVTAQMTLLHVPTLYSMAAAAAALSGEQAGVAAARQNLIVKFTDSYFSLLKAQTDKQIALGEINRLKQVLDQSQAFLKAGTGDIIAVYEAQSRLDGAGADLNKSESGLRLAEQKLSTLTGKPVSSVVNYLPQIPSGPDPDNIDWWVSTMEREQPVIRQAREGLTQTSEQRKAVKAEYLPILQASGGYDVNRGTASLPTAEVRQWYVGASISLPLYSGGETSAKIRRADATEKERRHILDETMDQQRENVKQAFFNLRYNISLIKALDQRKASAEIQLAAIKKGRKIGTRNAIDVLNAEQTYSIALRDCRYALYDNIISAIQLKSAAGILDETDVSELSRIEAPAPDNELNMIISRVSH